MFPAHRMPVFGTPSPHRLSKCFTGSQRLMSLPAETGCPNPAFLHERGWRERSAVLQAAGSNVEKMGATSEGPEQLRVCPGAWQPVSNVDRSLSCPAEPTQAPASPGRGLPRMKVMRTLVNSTIPRKAGVCRTRIEPGQEAALEPAGALALEKFLKSSFPSGWAVS